MLPILKYHLFINNLTLNIFFICNIPPYISLTFRCRFRPEMKFESNKARTITASMIVARALISGVTPVFSFVYIFTGRVFTLGPVTNKLMITSSKDMAKARSIPDNTAGNIMGNVMSQNSRNGPAPKSLAASSML